MLRVVCVLSALLFSGSLFAAPASAASVEKLLEVMKVQENQPKIQGQIEALLRSMLKQQIDAKKLPAAEQEKALQAMDGMLTRVLAVTAEFTSWEKMKPVFIKAYQETYSQEEVDGVTAFFGSPMGRAYLEKQPLLTQKSLELSKAQMIEMLPRLQQEARKAADELAGKQLH